MSKRGITLIPFIQCFYSVRPIYKLLMKTHDIPWDEAASLKISIHSLIQVHERSVQSDFLMVILKKILQVRRDLRVILMSATMESAKLSAYFQHCPVVSIPGRTFPVQVRPKTDIHIRYGGGNTDEVEVKGSRSGSRNYWSLYIFPTFCLFLYFSKFLRASRMVD